MTHEVDKHVGQAIRAQRRAVGLTQTDLANKIGVRFQQVQKYETGANRVSASRLWMIADVLGTEVATFFPANYVENDVARAQNDREGQLLRNFRAAPIRVRENILSLLELVS